jgi:hypothetical protein
MSWPATETARTAPQIRSASSPSPSRPRKPCGLSPCAPRRRTRAAARTGTSGGSPSAWRPTEGLVRTNRWWAAKRRQPPTGQRSRRAQARSRSRALRRGTAGRVERPAGGGHSASRQADRAAGWGGRQSRWATGARVSASPRRLQVFLRTSCWCFIGRSPGASRLRSPGWTHVGRGPRHVLGGSRSQAALVRSTDAPPRALDSASRRADATPNGRLLHGAYKWMSNSAGRPDRSSTGSLPARS